MTIEDVRDFYLALPDSDKEIFLAFVSHDLTIHGRGFRLDLSPTEQIRAFEGLNELQHQISGHISGLGLGTERYPDETLWQILIETAASHRLAGHLRSSLIRAGSPEYWSGRK